MTKVQEDLKAGELGKRSGRCSALDNIIQHLTQNWLDKQTSLRSRSVEIKEKGEVPNHTSKRDFKGSGDGALFKGRKKVRFDEYSSAFHTNQHKVKRSRVNKELKRLILRNRVEVDKGIGAYQCGEVFDNDKFKLPTKNNTDSAKSKKYTPENRQYFLSELDLGSVNPKDVKNASEQDPNSFYEIP